MATPYGIAYGIGAGLAGVPQAYMQGIGVDQQLQAREMDMARQQEAMQRAQLVDQQISAAVKEGGDIYGKLMSRFADKGLGQEAIKILEPYQKQKQMQSEAMKRDTISRIGMGDLEGAAKALQNQGYDITKIELDPTGSQITLHNSKGGSQQMRIEDAAGMYLQGTLGARLIQTGSREQMFQTGLEQKNKELAQKLSIEQMKDETRRWIAKLPKGLSGTGSDAYIRRVQFRTNELVKQGLSPEEAAKKAGEEFLPGGLGERGRVNTARMILQKEVSETLKPYELRGGLNPATIEKIRDPRAKEQAQADYERVQQLRGDLQNLGGSATPIERKPVAKPAKLDVSKVEWD